MRAVSRFASYVFNLQTLTVVFTAVLLCTQAAAQQGQTAARPDRGVNPGGAYAVSDVENISLQNGNVNLSIPLASLPPIAGGKLSLTVRAYYNSKMWNVTREEKEAGFPTQRYNVDSPQLSDAGGWNVDARYGVIIREASDDFAFLPPLPPDPNDGAAMAEFQRLTQHNWYKVMVRTPDGAEHELRPSGSGFLTYGGIDYPRSYLWGFHTAVPTAATGPIRYETTDGTYISAIYNPPNHASGVRWTIFLPDGTQVIDYFNGIQRIRDTNGNSIKIFSDGAGTHYQDEQTGREIRVDFDPAASNGYGQTRIWYQTVGGVWQHVDINHGETVVRGQLYKVSDWSSNAGPQGGVCTRHQQLAPQTIPVVREIVFPVTEPNAEGRRFTFSYNSDTTETATTQQFYYMCGQPPVTYTRLASRGMGALSRMVTPTGAQVDYTYTLASVHDFTGLLGSDRLTRETLAAKELKYTNLAGQELTDHWTYDIPYDSVGNTSTVTNPDGSTSTIGYYQRHPDFPRGVGTGELLAGQVFIASDGHTVRHKRWAMRGTAWATGTDGFTASNPYVEAEYTSLIEGGSAVKMSAKTYQYDFNGNVTQVTEYDWFDPNSVQRDSAGIPTGVPSAAKVLRVTDTSYYNPAADANSPNYYRLRNLTTGVPSFLNAVQETSVGASRTRYSYDGQIYGAAPTLGNPTQMSRLDDKGDADPSNDIWVTSRTSYGAYGNPSATTDPNGRVKQFFYEDATHALPTRVVIDPLNGTGTQTATTIYDYSTGFVTSTTDANNQTSITDYTNQLLNAVDPFGRPGVTRTPAGTAVGGATLYRKVFTFYEDAARRVRTETDLNTEGDRLLKSRNTSDELGRVLLTEQNEGGSSYTISAQTIYAQAGRVTLTSSPARNSSPESWMRVTKDVYGRIVEAASFGGEAQPSATASASAIPNWTGSVTTTYWANQATVTDQANKKRRSVSDGLGRLVRVDEPDKSSGALDDASGNPVQPTSYIYDAPGNLRRVEQGGQQRFFLYDSLARLVRAKNPEQGSMAADTDFPTLTDAAFGNSAGQWSMGYRYDAAGNLSKRKDARGVVTAYGYDGLNRNTSVTYTTTGSGAASTPSVTRSYDGATLGKGKLWKSESAQTGQTTVEEYDAAGRPLRQSQSFWAAGAWGAVYNVGYTYDLAGNLKTQTYPSGHSLNYTYDGAGRLSALTGNLGDGAARTYADAFAYDAAGRRRQERYGTDTPVYNKHLFNSRGQLAEIRVSTHGLFAQGHETDWNRGAIINHYSASGWGATGGGSDNNGNLLRQDVFVPSLDGPGYDQAGSYWLAGQSFDYDALNRLTRAAESSSGQTRWAQAFDYDRWGNRTINAEGTWLGPLPAPPAPPPPPSDQVNEAQFDKAELQQTNRLYAPGDAALSMSQRLMRYDGTGNLVYDAYIGKGMRAYDAENRMTSAEFFAGQTQTATYVYDADGRRVKRGVGTAAEMWQVYGAGGELLAEYAPNASPGQSQKEYGYRGGELLVTATAPSAGATAAPRVNVAASASGATAAASTSYGAYGLTPDKAINGSRTNAGSYWNDQTEGVLPDWLQVNFAGPKTIDEVDLFFIQDNLGTAEPTESMTFTQYGVTSLEVQYWAGTSWATVPGGSINGNNRVWRKVTFAPVMTDKIRVVVNGASDVWSRIVEVEAYEGTRAPADVRWLVTDQVGTPRMVLDRTGSLAGMTRHDYLPFGEELPAGTGGRAPAQVYSAADNVRQKFTRQERDTETGLDYFPARYYSPQMGRFASPDEFTGGAVEVFVQAASSNPTFYADLTNPQSLNKYQYCLHNPLRYIDPSGHQTKEGEGNTGGGLTEWFRALVRRFVAQTKPEETAREADENRTPNPVLGDLADGDKVVEKYVGMVAEGVDVGYQFMEVTGLDFGTIATMKALVKGDNKGAAIAGIFVAVNIVTAGRGKSAVVIGETMETRVIPVAKQLGAGWSKTRGAVTVEKTAEWIATQVRKGKTVFDIGINVNRAGGRSAHYLAEVEKLDNLGLGRIKVGTQTIEGQSYDIYQWVSKEAAKAVKR